MKILQGPDKEKFNESFLKAYLQDEFTAMTKREIDHPVLRLLVDHRVITILRGFFSHGFFCHATSQRS